MSASLLAVFFAASIGLYDGGPSSRLTPPEPVVEPGVGPVALPVGTWRVEHARLAEPGTVVVAFRRLAAGRERFTVLRTTPGTSTAWPWAHLDNLIDSTVAGVPTFLPDAPAAHNTADAPDPEGELLYLVRHPRGADADRMTAADRVGATLIHPGPLAERGDRPHARRPPPVRRRVRRRRNPRRRAGDPAGLRRRGRRLAPPPRPAVSPPRGEPALR